MRVWKMNGGVPKAPNSDIIRYHLTSACVPLPYLCLVCLRGSPLLSMARVLTRVSRQCDSLCKYGHAWFRQHYYDSCGFKGYLVQLLFRIHFRCL